MFRRNWLALMLVRTALRDGLATPACAENEGQDDLDKATQLKVTAETLDDLNEVIDRLDTALEKGLDKDNTKFAEQLLVSSLMQRGTMFATAVFNVPSRIRSAACARCSSASLRSPICSAPWSSMTKLWEAQLLDRQAASRCRWATRARPAGHCRRSSMRRMPRPNKRPRPTHCAAPSQTDEDKRLEDLNRAVELQPKKPDYLRLRGQLLVQQGEI